MGSKAIGVQFQFRFTITIAIPTISTLTAQQPHIVVSATVHLQNNVVKAMSEELLKIVLSKLAGFDFWFAVAVVAFTVVGWIVIGAKRKERKTLKRQLVFAAAMLSILTAGLTIRRLVPPKPFGNDVAGILILRLVGDADNSLQRELISSLNAAITKDKPSEKIEILGADDSVDERDGLVEAHRIARQLGAKRKALLVIWGAKGGDRRFYPRISIVRSNPEVRLSAERTFGAETIDEIRLPRVISSQPLYLVHFIRGYFYFDQENYSEALHHFDRAKELQQANDVEGADLDFFIGTSHWFLVFGQLDISEHLQKALDSLLIASKYYRETKDLYKLAHAQNNLGNVYADLLSGDRTANLNAAITCFETALRIYHDRGRQYDSAITLGNLGATLIALPTGDRPANLKRAIEALETALRVHTESNFPDEWATLQTHLGNAYRELPIGDRVENLRRAISAFEATLRIYSETESPTDWAKTQIDLGLSFYELRIADPVENIRKAIACYEAALRVYTERDYPVLWATAQDDLGIAYRVLPLGDHSENLQKAISYYEAALRIYSKERFPEKWARTQNHLGNVLAELKIGDRTANLGKAITALNAALSVYTEMAFPFDWARAENDLGIIYATMETGDRVQNLKKAITAFELSLRVRTEKDSPVEWAMTQLNLGSAYSASLTRDRITTLKKARGCFQSALRVFAVTTFPDYHKIAVESLEEAESELRALGQR